jgi:biopolymer transport protein ExbB
MVAAIIALAIHRILVTFQTKQLDYFSVVGGELELIYRQVWYEPTLHQSIQPHSNSHQPIPLTPSER